MLELITQHKADLFVIGTSLVTIASALANMLPKDSFFGKFVHMIAMNFKVK